MSDRKRYKYWFYYYIDDIDDIYHDLYAYTDSKELAKEFEKYRNMRKFFKKEEKISRREVNHLADEYPQRYLKNATLLTKQINGTGLTSANIVITTVEENTVRGYSANIITTRLWENTWMDYKIFNDNIIRALQYLKYTDGYDMISGRNPSAEAWKSLEPDELQMFIHLYGYTILK